MIEPRHFVRIFVSHVYLIRDNFNVEEVVLGRKILAVPDIQAMEKFTAT